MRLQTQAHAILIYACMFLLLAPAFQDHQILAVPCTSCTSVLSLYSQGVLLVLGQEDTSWNNMKKFLGAKAVKDEIVNYDARKITPDIRNKVRWE